MNHESGRRYALALSTGVIAAALAANSPLFAMRLATNAPVRARFDRVRFQFTTVAAFTVPVTAGRSLALVRGRSAAMTGGTAVTDEGQKLFADPSSYFDDGLSGDIRVATTGALTPGAATFDAQPVRLMTLAHLGAAGAYADREYTMPPDSGNEIVIAPGELLVIRNPVAMDAGGTFQLGIELDWREVPIIT